MASVPTRSPPAQRASTSAASARRLMVAVAGRLRDGQGFIEDADARVGPDCFAKLFRNKDFVCLCFADQKFSSFDCRFFVRGRCHITLIYSGFSS